jgi:uncharacterized membrane protein
VNGRLILSHMKDYLKLYQKTSFAKKLTFCLWYILVIFSMPILSVALYSGRTQRDKDRMAG